MANGAHQTETGGAPWWHGPVFVLGYVIVLGAGLALILVSLSTGLFLSLRDHLSPKSRKRAACLPSRLQSEPLLADPEVRALVDVLLGEKS